MYHICLFILDQDYVKIYSWLINQQQLYTAPTPTEHG